MLKNILKKGAVVFFSNIIQIPLNFISLFLTIQIIGVDGRGMSFLLISIVGLLSGLFQLGYTTAAIYHLNNKIYSKNIIFQSFILLLFLIMLTISVPVFLWQDEIFSLMDRENLLISSNAVLYIYLSIPLFMLFNFVSGIILAQQKSKLFAISNVLRSISCIFFIIFFAGTLSMSIEGVILSYLLSWLIPSILLIIKERFFTKLISIIELKKTFIDCLRWGIKQYPASLVPISYINAAPIIITPIAGVETVGLYSIASSISGAVSGFARSLATLLFGKLLTLDIAKSLSLAISASNFLFYSTFIVFLTSFIFLPIIVPLFFTNASIPAVNASYIMIISAILVSVQTPFSAFLNANNLQLKVSVIQVIALTIFIVILPILTIYYSLIGACFALLFSRLFSLIGFIYLLPNMSFINTFIYIISPFNIKNSLK